MVDRPGVRLSIANAEQFAAVGPMSERIVEFIELLRHRAEWLPRELRCRIVVESTARPHVGLGSGTQLAMSLAIGLNAFYSGPLTTAHEFAHVVGRGRRSAIGVYGALAGGMLVEAGKHNDKLSPLVCRVEIPQSWRFVLLTPQHEQGLSGADEERAFERLPPIAAETTAQLSAKLLLELLPAVVEGDFDRFSESLYRFGCIAGECFMTQQGGAFASVRSQKWVKHLRRLGIQGVGQTSWGPTLFALTDCVTSAQALVRHLTSDGSATDLELVIAAPNLLGTQVTLTT
jgi:beta-RFAP synthase